MNRKNKKRSEITGPQCGKLSSWFFCGLLTPTTERIIFLYTASGAATEFLSRYSNNEELSRVNLWPQIETDKTERKLKITPRVVGFGKMQPPLKRGGASTLMKKFLEKGCRGRRCRLIPHSRKKNVCRLRLGHCFIRSRVSEKLIKRCAICFCFQR